MSAITNDTSLYEPLLGALRQIQFWLEAVQPPQLMVAMPTWREFLLREASVHHKATKRPLKGPRVAINGDELRNQPFTLAHWPKDGLNENARSMLAIVISGTPALRIADYHLHCTAGDFLYIPRYTPKWDGNSIPGKKLHSSGQYTLALFWGGAPEPQRVSMRLCHYIADQDKPARGGETCWVSETLSCQVFDLLDTHIKDSSEEKSTFHLLSSFIFLVDSEIKKGNCFDSTLLPSGTLLRKQVSPIHHALQYIKNHLDQPLTIDIMANWVGLSRSAFTRHFRAATGETFVYHLTEQRLQKAKILLTQTNLPVERICTRVGIQSGRLRQLFRTKYGCSPTEYREMQKEVRYY